MIDTNTGLVLEGGGLRGVFTCGVLDCFMDHGIRFPFTVGVSAGACNGLTGKAEYFEEKTSSKRVMDIVRASSSLPFVSPVAYVDGIPMLDGGIADSIPVEYALTQGYEKLVVILTRNKGYRKKESKMRASKVFYRKYPCLQKALSERNAVYNKTMALIERLEEEGRIMVIRPLRPIEVGRMEKDTAKLTALYQEGYDIAMKIMKKMSFTNSVSSGTMSVQDNVM